MKRFLMGLLLVLLLGLLGLGLYGYFTGAFDEPEPTPTPTPTSTPTPTPTPTPEPTFDTSQFTDTNSLLIVANKKHRLPEGYEPSDLVNVNEMGGHGTIAPLLRKEAAEALVKMTQAADADGLYLQFSSAFRDENYQATLYNRYAAEYGVETADTISSRPGYSDHQSGLALDFIEGGGADFTEDFEYTDSGQWLLQHAHEYGFILRYPKGKEAISGYAYEPWHYRYIGVDYATEMYNIDVMLTFEEFFNVEGGDYE